MPKRKSSDERCGAGKRPAQQRKQHLYLVLDDWERGYSVRRLDVDAFDSDAGAGAADPPPERFTEPPVARIEAEHAMRESDRRFVSHGTKIFAMDPGEGSPAIPALDTRTLGMSVCPWPPSSSDRNYVLPFFASAAGKLFVFTDDATARAGAAYLGGGDRQPYSWTAMESRAARPPFFASQVTCHAMHPDGRTLFVSAGSRRKGRRSGTFSLDTERLEWTRHGDWLLPFSGEAHFDAELEAWVGLCGGGTAGAGRLCSCDVLAPVAAAGFTSPPPSWKLGEDELFRRNPELHLGAKLVHMGHGKFCLVEHMFHKDDEDGLRSDRVNARYCPTPRPRRVLEITTFGLKYNKEGQLRTSTLQRARACKVYKLPHDAGGSLKPLAFWL
ncbi:unnamed protein product [Urochloa decumbens]|uniref:Uncharacterized protein n=1 Tax=Urochloa decumbens TaxID=240449 RepID=A0ABC9EFM7_9POAL